MKPFLAICFMLLAFPPLSARAEEDAPRNLHYRAFGQPLEIALADIAQAFDLKLEVAELPAVQLTGAYSPASAQSFLRRLDNRYRLDWFLADRTLFVSGQRARRTKSLSFETREALDGFLFFLRRNGPKETADFPLRIETARIAIHITAPPAYLALIARLYNQYDVRSPQTEHVSQGAGVMIFRLKHAWAADKTYNFSRGVYEVPGVASLLRRLTDPTAPDPNAQNNLPPIPTRLLAAGESAPVAPAPPPPPNNAQKKDEKPKPVILADVRLNAVLIHDDQQKRPYYQNLIRQLDHPASLVEIEAVVVDIAKNRINDLGINWRASSGSNGVGFGNVGSSLSAEDEVGFSFGLGSLTAALSSNISGLLARIRLLETQGQSRVVSSPSVLTMDNLEAVINTTERFYIKVEGYQDSSVYPVEVGTTMRVTPHIIPRNPKDPNQQSHRIQLFVTIEDGAVDDSESTLVDGLPRIQENAVTTQAIVNQNGSLLIGGHVHTISSQSVSRVPVLGYIPILSYFFSRQEKIEREFVRLFIIRPRVRE